MIFFSLFLPTSVCHCNHHLFDKDRLEENTSCVSTSKKTFFSWPAPSTLLSTSTICFFGFFLVGMSPSLQCLTPSALVASWQRIEQKYFCLGNEHTPRCGGVDSSLLEVFLFFYKASSLLISEYMSWRQRNCP